VIPGAEGQFEVGSFMSAMLSCDHRVIDGSFLFLSTINQWIMLLVPIYSGEGFSLITTVQFCRRHWCGVAKAFKGCIENLATMLL
jgi:hypothetical protein